MACFSRWSSCQADFYSSSDSSEDEYDCEENEVDWEIDALSQNLEESVRWNELEAFQKLQNNQWDSKVTTLEMVQEVTHSSLNHLSSQSDSSKESKVDKLRRKLEKIKKKFIKKDQVRRERDGTDMFISESQDSFVALVKHENRQTDVQEVTDTFETEELSNKDKRFRKPFNSLSGEMQRLRTQQIFDAITKEAIKQQLTITQLLAHLLYRENYNSNRKFALEMFKVSLEEPEVTSVLMNKTIALVSRGRFGKTTYNYMRRMLKPHKEDGQTFCLI